jgi:hypothetical protein
MFCTKVCPAITTLTLWSCWSPRIGRSRALRRPWSPSTRLLAYCSVQCQAAGSSSPSTAGVRRRRLVGDDLDRDDRRYADGPLEEAVGGLGVAARGHEHVDDLPGLVDRTVHIPPSPSDPVGARKSVVGSELRLR